MAVMVELVISLLDQRITPTWWDRERRMEAIDNASLRQVSAIIDAESRVTCRSSMRRDRGHGTFEKTYERMTDGLNGWKPFGRRSFSAGSRSATVRGTWDELT